jgi:hypothetical protein
VAGHVSRKIQLHIDALHYVPVDSEVPSDNFWPLCLSVSAVFKLGEGYQYKQTNSVALSPQVNYTD